MLVVRFEFLTLWLALYKVSPTSWTVDYHNQVLVGSGHMRVLYPFLAGQFYPHYSHRLQKWELEDADIHKVPVVDSKLKVPVVAMSLMDYKPESLVIWTCARGNSFC